MTTLRLLLAEDDQDVRSFLREALSDEGFLVTAVGNGADAVVTAAEGRYDIYLLDMLMPGLDGVQTIRVLRAVTPRVPIIGLTGHMGRGYMAQASEYGVICLSKPVQLDNLVKEINEALGIHRPG